jgi:hypothetical protein
VIYSEIDSFVNESQIHATLLKGSNILSVPMSSFSKEILKVDIIIIKVLSLLDL